MPTDQALSSGDANGAHEVDEVVAEPLGSPERLEALPHIAAANELSRYDEALGPPHPPTAWLGGDEDLAPETKERAGDGALH